MRQAALLRFTKSTLPLCAGGLPKASDAVLRCCRSRPWRPRSTPTPTRSTGPPWPQNLRLCEHRAAAAAAPLTRRPVFARPDRGRHMRVTEELTSKNQGLTDRYGRVHRTREEGQGGLSGIVRAVNMGCPLTLFGRNHLGLWSPTGQVLTSHEGEEGSGGDRRPSGQRPLCP